MTHVASLRQHKKNSRKFLKVNVVVEIEIHRLLFKLNAGEKKQNGDESVEGDESDGFWYDSIWGYLSLGENAIECKVIKHNLKSIMST